MTSNKLSVIIPTMWKPYFIIETLVSLQKCDYVDEILVISNASGFVAPMPKLSKLTIIETGINHYVNPSWNVGYLLAKNDKLMFLNDDLSFDFSTYLPIISKHIIPANGMIGLHETCYKKEPDKFDILAMNKLTYGYACVFFIHKNRYSLIPNDMKIYHGDTWLFNKTKRQNFGLTGIKLDGIMSLTSNEKEFKSIEQRDINLWNTIYMKLSENNNENIS